MNAVARVFAIPELVRHTIYSITKPGDLSRAARVCKIWFGHAIPRLWSSDHSHKSRWATPDLDVLLQIAKESLNRFQHYLSYIQVLTVVIPYRDPEVWQELDQDPLIWSSFRGKGLFLRWRKANEYRYAEHVDRHLQALVRPSLKVVSIGNGELSGELLACIQRQCPNLQVLLQPAEKRSFTLDEIMNTISGRDLIYLELNCIARMDEDMLSRAMSVPYAGARLQNLVIDLGHSLAMLPTLIACAPLLSALSVVGDYHSQSHIEFILQSITHLHATLAHLHIEVRFVSGRLSRVEEAIIAACEGCPQLCCLRIKTSLWAEDPPSENAVDLARVQGLVRNLLLLESLAIQTVLTETEITMVDLLQLISALPNLQFLNLECFSLDVESPCDPHMRHLLESRLIQLSSFRAFLALDPERFQDIYEELCEDALSFQNLPQGELTLVKPQISHETACRIYVRSIFAFAFTRRDRCELYFPPLELDTISDVIETAGTGSIYTLDKIHVQCTLTRSRLPRIPVQDAPSRPGRRQAFTIAGAFGYDSIYWWSGLSSPEG